MGLESLASELMPEGDDGGTGLGEDLQKLIPELE